MDIFQALADPTRREIIDLLFKSDRSVGELCERFEVSQPAISRHLRILRDGGLVASRIDAQRRVYSLTPEPLREIERWLDRNQKFWQKRLDALDGLLGSRRKVRKTRKV